MDSLTIETVLVARTYLYRLFQALFGADPTREVLDLFFSDTTEQALDCFGGADAEEYDEAVSGLREHAAAYGADPEGFLAAAERDYMHQFVGPHDLKAPPWGCVYLTNERILFQESTLKVREAYRSENMLPTQYPHVSDDHIAIELDFMAKLSVKCHGAFTAQDEDGYRRLIETQRSFLQEHMVTWTAKYAAKLTEAAPDSLYARLGEVCDSYLRIDAEVLGELEEVGCR